MTEQIYRYEFDVNVIGANGAGIRATTTVQLGETRGWCASISGVPSAEGPEIGKRTGPRLAGPHTLGAVG